MMLDRKKQPDFGRIEEINLQEPKMVHLDNGIPVLCIDAGTQNVLKVELVFNAGTSTADKILVASTSVKTLTEGTAKHNAKEIAEAVDFYGAYLQNEVDHDESSICLYSLNKHLDKTLTTLAEVYASASFPEHELETVLKKSQQEMLISQEKVGYLGAKAFSAALYGKDHPYGRSADVEDYSKIDRKDLADFHSLHIKNGIKYILVAGKLSDDTVSNLNTFFGNEKRNQLSLIEIEAPGIEASTVHVTKVNAVQNSIKIGRVLFNRSHQDFIGLRILTTVLGGYFGSRLMTNIREDKGYTYGIGAGMVSMKHSGYLSISTEVGADVCEAALTEIHLEIEKLRNSLIPSSELELVKNYMLGSILKSIDGPFDISAKWKGYMKYGLGIDAHYELIRQIKATTPEGLRDLANTYLQKKDLVQVTAGADFKS
jgi:predicted Zn-dependent peptidase